MQQLVQDSEGQKLLLVLDNLREHYAKEVPIWVLVHEDEIKLYCLPPYAPQSNPYAI